MDLSRIKAERERERGRGRVEKRRRGALSRAASLRRKRGKKSLVGYGNRDLARLRIWELFFWGLLFIRKASSSALALA